MLAFLAPAFLLGALTAAVPIVLHLFRRRTENEVAFSAVRFLRRAPVEQARRRKLRELLLLALRVTALLLLALAFARPYFTAANATAGPVTVVAVDRSFSVSAPGQFARVQGLAKKAIAAAPAAHRVALVAFDDIAEVAAVATHNRGDARAAVDRLRPGFGATRYGVALARSAELIGAATGRVIVVTDLQESGWAHGDRGAIASHIPVEVIDAGAQSANLAVVEVRAEADGVMALIRNFGLDPRSGPARFAIDNRPVAEASFSAAPGLSTTVRFSINVPSQGVGTVMIQDDQGFRADDVRYVLFDPPEPEKILLATASGGAANDAFYLERALLSGGTNRFRLRRISGARLTDLTVDELRKYRAVLLVSTRGLNRQSQDLLRKYVEQGGGLLVAAGPDTDAATLGDLLVGWVGVASDSSERPRLSLSLAPVDARHPIFRAFGTAMTSLSAVRFSGTVRVVEDRSGRVIGRFSDGSPALVERSTGQGRVLFLASDLNSRWNDFPLHSTFVPFVHELARYLADARDVQREVLVGDLPERVDRRPGPQTLVVQAGAGTQRQTGRRVVVNVDPLESDPARLTTERFTRALTRLNRTAAVEAKASAKSQEERQRLWQYGLLLMVVGLVIEGVLGSRMG